MSAAPERVWTVDEYLAADRDSDLKHEYLNGYYYAMAGAKRSHNLVSMSTGHALYPHVRRHGCEIYPSDMRVKTPSGMYAYPDIVLVCGKPQIVVEKGNDTLLNPTIIVEVMSPTTERFDRTTKFREYRSLPSLQEYILIAQDKPLVERFVRQPDGNWVYYDAVGLDAAMDIAALDCIIALSEVYEQVTFEEEQPPEP